MVDRTLPTDEAKALLELTGEIAAQELAPKAATYEGRDGFRARCSGSSADQDCGLPYAEEYGGAEQPTRYASRCWRSCPARG